jgi:hypothetical protein
MLGPSFGIGATDLLIDSTNSAVLPPQILMQRRISGRVPPLCARRGNSPSGIDTIGRSRACAQLQFPVHHTYNRGDLHMSEKSTGIPLWAKILIGIAISLLLLMILAFLTALLLPAGTPK